MNQHTPIFDFDNFNILNCILNGSLGLTMKDNNPPSIPSGQHKYDSF